MCGIAGIISLEKIDKHKAYASLQVLNHRGPDGEGQWLNEHENACLMHKRLSIIDLSENAAQPMRSKDDRYVVAFNGEIYNYLELKKQLIAEGVSFSTQSDTEVLLELFIQKGPSCLELLEGMFAVAIWDCKEKKLFCARDRFGEKPFYYHFIPGKIFAFASEMKFFWAYGLERKMNNKAIADFLSETIIAGSSGVSSTFYSGIHKLPPSTWVTIDLKLENLSVKKYWDIDLSTKPIKIVKEEASKEFRRLFTESVRLRLRSDVPVGTSLSGGLDSSSVVAVIKDLRRDSSLAQKTFSARFKDFDRDEGKYMEMMLQGNDLLPEFTWPAAEDFLKDFDRLVFHQEEPFQSASIYAQWQVMKLAKQNGVKVLLDGQGADEILGGYKKYRYTYMNELYWSDPELYSAEAEAILKEHDPSFRSYENKESSLFQKAAKSKTIRKTKAGLKKLFASQASMQVKKYPSYFSSDFVHTVSNPLKTLPEFDNLRTHLYHDTMVSGLGTLLNYADKNSMAHSVEVRLPFLSRPLVEFVFSLPSSLKINNGWSKFIQREAMKEILPEGITWRKDKVGYEAPQKDWMQMRELKERTEEAYSFLADMKIINRTESAPPGWNALILVEYLKNPAC